MKSYLSLIPISAGVRRKQSKKIILCIVLAVFLVTVIFSLAEAGLKMELNASVDKKGYWHICVKGIQEGDAREIAGRDDVAAASWYNVLNLDEDLNMDKEYYMEGARTALCGIEDSFIGEIMHYFSEGAHVGNGNEVILTENARELLGVETGDRITLNTPAGDYDFVISGFRITGGGKYVSSNGGQTSALLVKDDQIGAFMDIETFRSICEDNGETGNPQYYIRFGKQTGLKKAVGEIRERYGLTDSDVELNTILMAACGISNSKYIKNVYPIAAVLFLLILAAGVMMISGSMNSDAARRLQFFGMLRCIGASRSQIIRLVRLEALNWCKSAVPLGTALGVLAAWLICAGLKYIVGGEFTDIPVLRVSAVGVLSGAAVGVITVFLAAQAPAKRAAGVSPTAAVSGNAGSVRNVKHAAAGRGRMEVVLGVHHAVSSGKNLLLMTGSFALSIVLFFCFSVLVELVGILLPQKASSPDMDITSTQLQNDIDASLLEAVSRTDGVAHAFGRSVCKDVAAVYLSGSSGTEGGFGSDSITGVDMISYDDYALDLLRKDDELRKGSDLAKVYGDSNGVLVIWDKDMPWEIGDKIKIAGEEMEIAGMLRYNPFTNDGSSGGVINVIASRETFMRLTGISDYMIVDVQLTKEKSDETAAQIRELSGGYHFRDRREEGEAAKEFDAMMVFGYGFIAIIALIALLNIMNSISMSVSARTGQYGAMRAIGMSGRQLVKMIAAEAFTYAAFGCAAGCTAGLALSKYLYDFLITAHFYYYTWEVSFGQIAAAVLFVSISALAAVHAPSKRIREMAVTETINEL